MGVHKLAKKTVVQGVRYRLQKYSNFCFNDVRLSVFCQKPKKTL